MNYFPYHLTASLSVGDLEWHLARWGRPPRRKENSVTLETERVRRPTGAESQA